MIKDNLKNNSMDLNKAQDLLPESLTTFNHVGKGISGLNNFFKI